MLGGSAEEEARLKVACDSEAERKLDADCCKLDVALGGKSVMLVRVLRNVTVEIEVRERPKDTSDEVAVIVFALVNGVSDGRKDENTLLSSTILNTVAVPVDTTGSSVGIL